jgi:hypothetical protein
MTPHVHEVDPDSDAVGPDVTSVTSATNATSE